MTAVATTAKAALKTAIEAATTNPTVYEIYQNPTEVPDGDYPYATWASTKRIKGYEDGNTNKKRVRMLHRITLGVKKADLDIDAHAAAVEAAIEATTNLSGACDFCQVIGIDTEATVDELPYQIADMTVEIRFGHLGGNPETRA